MIALISFRANLLKQRLIHMTFYLFPLTFIDPEKIASLIQLDQLHLDLENPLRSFRL